MYRELPIDELRGASGMRGKRGTKESMKAPTPNCTTSRDRVVNTFFGSYLSLRTALLCNLAAKKRETNELLRESWSDRAMNKEMNKEMER